ncbi:MAG: tetratricopeptide repeat protein [Alphaproteobacteria bacterium]|nr:MAG: tetratricopeptide repeat protein [Alphaproteobacteria bacterium]
MPVTASKKKQKGPLLHTQPGFPPAAMSKKASQAIKAFAAGQRHSQAKEWPEAVKQLLIAWDGLPDNSDVLTLLANALVQLGVREKAIEVLQHILTKQEPNANVCAIMLQMANEMEMYDIAIKVGHVLVQMDPDQPNHYVNLASAYGSAGRYDEGIALLQQVLQRHPEHSDLWNNLASIVRFRDGVEAADVFYEESLRLNPRNFKALSNYALSQGARVHLDKALDLFERAIALKPDNPEPRVGAAVLLFHKGMLDKGWDYYDYRYSGRRKQNQSQIFTHGVPEWDGSSLEGKTLLVAAEQGIGDEVMFGNYLPFLYDQAEKLIISCDRRLVSIYQRRFPDAIVERYRDGFHQGYRYRSVVEVEKAKRAGALTIDASIRIGSAARYAWRSTADIKPHPEGFLIADPERAREFREQLAGVSARPKVGIAWRSGFTGVGRTNGYADIEDMGPLFALKDQVDFVCLQYDNCKDELARARDMFGVDVIQFDDVDLKGDIEANLAIMDNLDVMVAAHTAPAHFAMSLGRPTILLSRFSPWWCFGADGRIPFIKDCTFGIPGPDSAWEEIVEDTANRVRTRLGLSS